MIKIKEVKDFYDKMYKEYKEGDVRRLGWGSEESQLIRFRVMEEIGIRDKDTVLDVGCGFGGFLNYLLGCVRDMGYLGIDYNPKAIEWAKKHSYGIPRYFKIAEVFEIKKKFDWVIANGIFAIDYPKWNEDVFKTLKHMFKICNKGVGASFLSNLVPGKRVVTSRYVEPTSFLQKMVYPITTNFTIRHDYKDNDFTVYMYKEER